MNILVFARGRGGVSPDAIQPYITAEIQAVWDLYSQGICREVYARADRPGSAILMVESARIEAAQNALASLPLVALNLIDLDPTGSFHRLCTPVPAGALERTMAAHQVQGHICTQYSNFMGCLDVYTNFS